MDKNIIKIMTYNVGEWFDGRENCVPDDYFDDFLKLQNDIFSTEKVDILFAQEVVDNFSKNYQCNLLLSKYFKFNYYQNTNKKYCGKSFNSNLKLSNISNYVFLDQKRNYSKSELLLGNKKVSLYNVHLSLNIDENSKEIDELLTLLEKEDYFILAGDMNFGCNNKNNPIYSLLYKRFLDNNYNLANGDKFGFIETFYRGNDDNHCFDQIVTSKNIEILSVHTNSIKLERKLVKHIDHIPLIAEIKIN